MRDTYKQNEHYFNCLIEGHLNYARYLTYQHVSLSNLHQTNPTAKKELKENGVGGCITRGSFSTVHGDFITEVTVNREVKVRGGLMQEASVRH